MNSNTSYSQNATTNTIINSDAANNNGNLGEVGNPTAEAEPFWKTFSASVMRHRDRDICNIGSCVSNLNPDQKEVFQNAVDILKKRLSADTWRTLEVGGHLGKNEKLGLVAADVLAVGIDVASNKFNWRAFDNTGIEFTTRAVENSMTREGIDSCIRSMCELAVLHGKTRITVAIEPTGHYWYNLYNQMIINGVTVVMVNAFAVNRLKEVDDNSQLKSDDKDPAVIARLLRDGAFSIPYLPEGDYAELRGWANLRERAVENHTRTLNQIHRWVAIYYPELESVYRKLESPMALEILGRGLLPQDLVKLGANGILDIFIEMKVRGCRVKKATELYESAKTSIGRTEGLDAAREEIKALVADIRVFAARMDEFEGKMIEACEKAYPSLSKVVEIRGITAKTLASFLADVGDMNRFDSADEMVKIAGLAPVVCQSGKYKGIPKISKRGRKRMRSYLFIMAESVAKYDSGFKEYYEYLCGRKDNPLKYKQAMMNISTKLIRVIRALLQKGTTYNPEKLIADSKRMREAEKKSAENDQK